MHFVYLKVPLASALGRAPERLHDAIEQDLVAAGAGSVLSWGTSLPSVDASEHDPGAFHRVDLGLRQLDAGLEALRARLLAMDAPDGTELHFTESGEALQQVVARGRWSERGASNGTHRPRITNGKA